MHLYVLAKPKKRQKYDTRKWRDLVKQPLRSFLLVQPFMLHKEVGIPDPATGALSSCWSVVFHSIIIASFHFNPTAFHHVVKAVQNPVHTSLNFSPCFTISPHLSSLLDKGKTQQRMWSIKCVWALSINLIGVNNGTGIHLNYCLTWHGDNYISPIWEKCKTDFSWIHLLHVDLSFFL